MRDPAELTALETIYGLASRSFLRYLAEDAAPIVLTPEDREVYEILESWNGEVDEALGRIGELLRLEKVHPVPPLWPLSFAQYNMVSAFHLARPLVKRQGPLLDRLAAEAAKLEGWPEASEEVRRLLARERFHFGNLDAFVGTRPLTPPKAAVKKGTSANFW